MSFSILFLYIYDITISNLVTIPNFKSRYSSGHVISSPQQRLLLAPAKIDFVPPFIYYVGFMIREKVLPTLYTMNILVRLINSEGQTNLSQYTKQTCKFLLHNVVKGISESTKDILFHESEM